MAEPVTILSIAGLGWVAGQVAVGAAGSASDRASRSILRGYRDRVAGLRGMPENHDVARAVRTAQIQALERLIGDYRANGRPEWETEPHTRPEMFFERAGSFCSQAIGRCLDPKVKLNLDVSEPLTAAIDGILAEPPYDTPSGRRAEAIAAFAEEAVLGELRAALDGVILPDGFEQHFRQGNGARPRYLELFGAYVAEQIKRNEPFRAIFVTGQLARIEGLAFDSAEMLARMEERFGGALGRIEKKVEDLPDAVVQRLLAAFEARGEFRAAEEAHVQRRAIVGLAQRISATVEDFDQALKELEYAVEIAVAFQEEGRRGTNAGELVDAVLARMAELSAEGRFDEAAAEADSAFAAWEREEEERRRAALNAGVKLLDAGLKQDLLRRDAASGARRVARRVELETPDPAALFAALRAAQDEWYVRGRDKGLNLELEVSVELARLCVERASGADRRGTALNDLAVALSVLGGRESGTARLEEAVAAYRAALEEFTRERVPLDWATTQNNLGNALWRLGERESGTTRLEEAVAAYRAALEERTRERVPLDWATTQNNLGNALSTLGERESGTARLEEAVAAYRAALEERTRERVPLQWATTQNNLGTALQTLGARESGTARLEEAVAAYRAALEEWTRERVPFQWAHTQENLAIVALTLGERTGARAWLEEARAVVDGAIEVYRDAESEFHIDKAERLRGRILAALDGA